MIRLSSYASNFKLLPEGEWHGSPSYSYPSGKAGSRSLLALLQGSSSSPACRHRRPQDGVRQGASQATGAEGAAADRAAVHAILTTQTGAVAQNNGNKGRRDVG